MGCYASNLMAQRANLIEGESLALLLEIKNADKPLTNFRKIKSDYAETTLFIRCSDTSSDHMPVLPDVEMKQSGTSRHAQIDTSGLAAGTYVATVMTDQNGTTLKEDTDDAKEFSTRFNVASPTLAADVTLRHSSTAETRDRALWVAIRNRTDAIGFSRYQNFINTVFGCAAKSDLDDIGKKIAKASGITSAFKSFSGKFNNMAAPPPRLSVQGPYAYSVLKMATQAFLAVESGVLIRDADFSGVKVFDSAEEAERLDIPAEDPRASCKELEELLNEYLQAGHERLPYLDRVADAILHFKKGVSVDEVLPYCEGILQHRLSQPSLIELIWSYWHEEGMLAQTMNAIAFRFQNLRSSPNDPLGELEIDPLRPLNNIIWGYVQDRHNRLSIARRAFEYDHHYGLKLVGKAVPELRSADSRSKFIEAFHNLLHRTAVFYREDADTTVLADAFALLNALKDVHLLLAQGAHNQYGDLPWTARAEMLTEQWMLARPEMREFLRGRHMVPYQEAWMGAVDAMKKLQGWTDSTITHFNELAVDGERLLLSIRFGNWSDISLTEANAKNWARYWKPEIQRYLYGYLAVTGVDLMADSTDSRDAAIRKLQPSQLLQRRLDAQGRASGPGASAMSARIGAAGVGYLRGE